MKRRSLFSLLLLPFMKLIPKAKPVQYHDDFSLMAISVPYQNPFMKWLPKPRTEMDQDNLMLTMEERIAAWQANQPPSQYRQAPWYCDVSQISGRLCYQPAGYGTEHLGIGRCSTHEGLVPDPELTKITNQYL